MEIRRCMKCMNELSDTNQYCPACGAKVGEMEQPAYALKCNYILHGRYLIGSVLGQGGFGITYIGLDMTLNVKVAVKEYFPMGMVTRENGESSKILWNTSRMGEKQRQGGYESSLKEARKMAKIDGIPSIVRVRDMFLDNETSYIVMDFVEGITFKQKISREGPISFSECISLLRPMMEDLEQVHRQGMIHRDISPDNIMIQPDGRVRLLDLGAAKDMTAVQGVSSQVVAKGGFSPLEQYKTGGNVGPWTDVYALCATIYYCITGRLLPAAFDRMDNEEISFPDSLKEPLPAAAEEALRAGLAVSTERRTRSVEDLLHQLETGKAATASASVPESGSGRDEREISAFQPRPKEEIRSEEAEMRPEPKAAPETQPLVKKVPGKLPMLRADFIGNRVLGSNLMRNQINTITFLDSLKNMPENAKDVSARQDRTVMAWTEKYGQTYDLYIAGEGGVSAPHNCARLFGNYSRISEINFNNCFDTSEVIYMMQMFLGCKCLTQLDLSSFDVSRVVNMAGMFNGCLNLRQLNLTGFNLNGTMTVNWMFYRCGNLATIEGISGRPKDNGPLVLFLVLGFIILFYIGLLVGSAIMGI